MICFKFYLGARGSHPFQRKTLTSGNYFRLQWAMLTPKLITVIFVSRLVLRYRKVCRLPIQFLHQYRYGLRSPSHQFVDSGTAENQRQLSCFDQKSFVTTPSTFSVCPKARLEKPQFSRRLVACEREFRQPSLRNHRPLPI